MMLADMTLADEKKTQDWGDDKIAEAESLAAEALRAAEEAKRAAERLAEVRASLKILNGNKPKPVKAPTPETPVSKIVPTTTPVSKEETPTKEEVEAETEKVDPEPEATPEEPAPRSTTPVSILKSPSYAKSETKEVRYAPDTVIQNEEAPTPEEEEFDLIVQMFDAVGIDKICGLNSSEAGVRISQQKPFPKVTAAAMAAYAAVMASVNAEKAASVNEEKTENEATEKTSDTEKTEQPNGEVKFAPLVPPMMAAIAAAAASLASPKIEPATQVPTTPAPVAIVADPPASAEKEMDIKETLATSGPIDPVEEKQVPVVAEEMAAESTEAKESETPTEKTQDAQPQKTTALSPVKQQILIRRRQHHLISKADPFGGEHDGMDFLPCGSGDACGVTAFPDIDDSSIVHQGPPSNPMVCGWGA